MNEKVVKYYGKPWKIKDGSIFADTPDGEELVIKYIPKVQAEFFVLEHNCHLWWNHIKIYQKMVRENTLEKQSERVQMVVSNAYHDSLEKLQEVGFKPE